MSAVARVLVVDDEPLARKRLLRLLRDEPGFEVLGECANGREAILAIEEEQPDLVLLDVQMPEVNGFEVVSAVGADRMPAIVFVTAFDEFALRAFDVHALDYLLKPVDPERFRRAMQRVRSVLGQERDEAAVDRLRGLLRHLQQRPEYLDRVAVRTDGRILLVRTREIDWIEGEGNYVRLHVGNEVYLVREKMGSFEERLDPQHFMRVHRSTIVNLERIVAMEPLFKGDYVLILRDGTRLTTTRSYRDQVRRILE